MKVEDFKQLIKEDDILYTYKIKAFNGFAPCFDNDKYSLACCKGNRKNGGMRVSVAKNFINNQDKNIWIMGIAAKNATINCTISYNQGNLIYLAKIERTASWKQYYKEYADRADCIYYIDRTKTSLKQKENQFHCECEMPTDCTVDHPDYVDLKQIVLSDNFIIFNSDIPCPKELNANRGYRYKGLNICKLIDCITEEKVYKINSSPKFTNAEKNCGGCK